MIDPRLPRELRAWRAWEVARRFPDGVRDPAFRALVQRVDGGPVHRCPPVALLTDGEAAFSRMLSAIASARLEVLLETYILRDDTLGISVQQALVAAAQRGVRVCVLADAVGSLATHDAFWRTLEAGGVTVRQFHRFWHHPFEALRRDHRKLLVIDRDVAFTGGMNIGEEYGSSIRRRRDAWRDTFVEVQGSVARELAAVFAEGWDRARGPVLPGLEYVSWSDAVVRRPVAGGSLSGARALQARVQWQLAQQLGRRRDRRRGRRVRREATTAGDEAPGVVVLDPRPGRAQREMLAVLAALVGGARERLWITTPYFAPPTRALRLLTRAAQRGVDVRLLLPSERTDVPIVRHAAHGAYQDLLAHGVRIWEYERATLHAKTLVVDGYVGLVGSSNLDFRSFWLNAECNVLLFDEACGHSLEVAYQHDLSGSREVTIASWAQRTRGHRWLDATARALRWAL
ncbi:phospholipase D-like domain-containing protein [Gemmatimonas sp.]|uniref:phospholipase D-like domain-containing protein n=1 Tax=Gemmatimonas sp. TaxID=1962908 RepID=UPI00391947A5